MALHSEAKKALDAVARKQVHRAAGEQQASLSPKPFAALNAILVACQAAENTLAFRGGEYAGRSPQVSVSGLRAIIARELK